MSNRTQMSQPPCLRAKATAAYLNMSVSSLWRLLKLGLIPQPIKIGQRMTVWKREDLDAFLGLKKDV